MEGGGRVVQREGRPGRLHRRRPPGQADPQVAVADLAVQFCQSIGLLEQRPDGPEQGRLEGPAFRR